jgi:hypothetical protein
MMRGGRDPQERGVEPAPNLRARGAGRPIALSA